MLWSFIAVCFSAWLYVDASYRGPAWRRWVFKPVTLILLLLLAWQAPMFNAISYLVLAGLCASLLGDALTLLPRQRVAPTGDITTACRLDKSLPMVQLSQRLLLESMGGTTLSASESEAALEAIACLLRPVLHQRDPAPSRREKQFQKIIALIDASIQSEHLRPEWLASETGMSVRSLYRLFADQGLVVAQYIKNRRLDLCAQALQNVHDDEKLAGIGYRWGFSDHSHFSTAFKQRFGVTPGEYRKRCR